MSKHTIPEIGPEVLADLLAEKQRLETLPQLQPSSSKMVMSKIGIALGALLVEEGIKEIIWSHAVAVSAASGGVPPGPLRDAVKFITGPYCIPMETGSIMAITQLVTETPRLRNQRKIKQIENTDRKYAHTVIAASATESWPPAPVNPEELELAGTLLAMPAQNRLKKRRKSPTVSNPDASDISR